MVVKCAQPLDGDQQRALWNALAQGGMTEPMEEPDGPPEADDPTNEPRVLMASPWMPPDKDELLIHESTLAHVAATFGIAAAWFFQVETGVDGLAWLEDHEQDDDEDDADDESLADQADGDGESSEQDDDDISSTEVGSSAAASTITPLVPPEMKGIFATTAADSVDPSDSVRVLFKAPDAPDQAPTPWSDIDAGGIALDDMSDDEDIDDDSDIGAIEYSRWRNGVPPFELSVSFPLERYPDILDNYDASDFGIAIKLAGPPVAGEDAVINAMFALWLSAYQDERTDAYEPFQRADVIHDKRHRSALLGVEQLRVPASAADQVHFLMWIVARINDVTPIFWARFDSGDEAEKVRLSADQKRSFVLAGNPISDRMNRQGEEAAIAWANTQSMWSKRELAGMLIEVALQRSPSDPSDALIAERLLRKAISWTDDSDAHGYLAVVLVRQRKLPEACVAALAAPDSNVRILTVIETAQSVATRVIEVIPLIDATTLAAADDDALAELVTEVAKYSSDCLELILPMLPNRSSLVPHLYNASFGHARSASLEILMRVTKLPIPTNNNGEARTAYAMSWNNACIHAHAMKLFNIAAQIADDGLAYASENSYMYHSAACAYAAIGNNDLALQQITHAMDANYAHIEKMETDADLAPLFTDPRFAALFVEWRARRADLN
jgi:hypothetical protein